MGETNLVTGNQNVPFYVFLFLKKRKEIKMDEENPGPSSSKTIDSRSASTLLLSEEAIVIDNLGDSSGSEDDLGTEAKRILRKRKKEKEKLAKLGKLIPIGTDIDPDQISL